MVRAVDECADLATVRFLARESTRRKHRERAPRGAGSRSGRGGLCCPSTPRGIAGGAFGFAEVTPLAPVRLPQDLARGRAALEKGSELGNLDACRMSVSYQNDRTAPGTDCAGWEGSASATINARAPSRRSVWTMWGRSAAIARKHCVCSRRDARMASASLVASLKALYRRSCARGVRPIPCESLRRLGEVPPPSMSRRPTPWNPRMSATP